MRYLPVVSRILVILLVLIWHRSAAAGSALKEDVRYKSSVPLAAALLLPETAVAAPAVVVVHGSGSSDRTNVWARAIADLFVKRGFVVLLPDKRGSGLSGGDWQRAGFDELASDALAGVDYLKSRKEINPQRIGLVGLSQGGWIVPLAAVRRPDVAFVINLSGATVSYAEQSFVEMTNTARQAGLSDEAVDRVVQLNQAAGRYLLGGSWSDYAALRANALASAAKPVAAGFPGSPDAPIWEFLRKVGSYDPLPYWSVLEQPVFIGLGEKDEADNVPVQESVRRIEWVFRLTGKRNYDIVVAPGVGHALWNADRQFAAVLVERLDAWLKAHVTVNAAG